MANEERNEEMIDVLKHGRFPKKTAIRYLNLYLGSADWEKSLNIVWNRINRFNRMNTDHQMRQEVSCAILLPAIDRSMPLNPENPQNLLLSIYKYHQLKDRDWFEKFQETFQRDVDIDTWRSQVVGCGIIRPVEYAPMPRQAFNWLYLRAEEAGVIISPEIKQDISERFTRLVEVYGGAVICNIFSRHSEILKKIVNWRTQYFFERAIFNVYTSEQVLKIKKAELEQTNQKLVQSVTLL